MAVFLQNTNTKESHNKGQRVSKNYRVSIILKATQNVAINMISQPNSIATSRKIQNGAHDSSIIQKAGSDNHSSYRGGRSGLETVCEEALSSLAMLSPPSLWKEGVSEIVRLCFVLIILTSSLSKRPRYSCTMPFKVARGSQRGKSTGVSAG